MGTLKAARLHWWPEDHLDKILTTTRERKIRSTEELEAAMKEPRAITEHFSTGPPWARNGPESFGEVR